MSTPQRAAGAPVEIVSFGYLHGPPPTAHLILDLRSHFRDPHVDPGLRELTAYRSGPSAGPVTVAVGCAGGRHRHRRHGPPGPPDGRGHHRSHHPP